MIRYFYNRQYDPPAPFVHVTLRCAQTGKDLSEVPAQLDTAADRSSLPWNIVEALGLVQIDEALVEVYGGEVAAVPIFCTSCRHPATATHGIERLWPQGRTLRPFGSRCPEPAPNRPGWSRACF